MQSLTPPTTRMSVYNASWTRQLGFAHYDACTVHYLNGRHADGTGEDLLGQRVYRTMKRIRQEILDHCSTISIYLV